LRLSFQGNTARAYCASIETYLKWCQKNSYVGKAAEQSAIDNYFGGLVGVKSSKARIMVAAVKWYAEIYCR
jgi:site-specific recombinase XerD